MVSLQQLYTRLYFDAFYVIYTSRAVEPMMVMMIMMMICTSAWAGIAGRLGDRIPVGT